MCVCVYVRAFAAFTQLTKEESTQKKERVEKRETEVTQKRKGRVNTHCHAASRFSVCEPVAYCHNRRRKKRNAAYSNAPKQTLFSLASYKRKRALL